jgi:hypothetical protein
MSISSREDANKYYQLVNKLVDNYMDKWKIRPTNLKRYLKTGSDKFEKFIERNGLKDINGIKQVINDVINDRVSMERDGILKFESFKVFESDEFKITSLSQCLYKGIGKTDIKAEKFLADHFDTNLSQIDIVDSDKHLFKVTTWENDNLLVIVYNKDEIDIIKENMIEYLKNELIKQKLDLIGITIPLEDIIDKSKIEIYINGFLSPEKISDLINNSFENKFNKFEKTDDFYLWSKES